VIRRANKEDIKMILDLFNSNSYITGGIPKFEENYIDEYLTHELFNVFVFEHEGKVIGAITAEFLKKAKQGYVSEVIVSKEHRRKGIAKQLLNHVEEEAIKEGINLISLHVDVNNEEMQKFMEKRKYSGPRRYIEFSKCVK